MAKVVAMRLTLDDEISALVTRIGALPQPKNHIVKYSVDRAQGQPSVVTVQFIADGEFCRPSIEVTGLDKTEPEFVPGQQEIPLNEDGSK